MPYYKNATTPIVFNGVNWSAAEYGFPYDNVTGIVEVAPIRAMLERAVELVGKPVSEARAFYLGANTLTEGKNRARFEKATAELGIALAHQHAATLQDWQAGYAKAQEHDFLIVGSYSGITDWDADAARRLHADGFQVGVLSFSAKLLGGEPALLPEFETGRAAFAKNTNTQMPKTTTEGLKMLADGKCDLPRSLRKC